jgi:hypothetical protein
VPHLGGAGHLVQGVVVPYCVKQDEQGQRATTETRTTDLDSSRVRRAERIRGRVTGE